MVVAVFDNNSRNSEGSLIDSDHVLRYYEDRKHVVRELCVGGQLWQDEHVGELAGIVRGRDGGAHHHTSNDICLQRLSLSNNELTSGSADSLANIVENVHTLRELDLSDNKVELSGLKRLGRALRGDRSALRSLNLFNNHLSSKCADQISDILRDNTTLVSLNLGKNQLRSMGCIAKLATAFQRNAYLQQLDLSHNKMGNKGATKLAPVLDPSESLCPLQELNLANNNLTEAGIHELIGAMIEGQNTQLTKLILSNNNLGGNDKAQSRDGEDGSERKEGIRACAIFLQYSHTIQEMILSACNVGDEGVELLCHGIQEEHLSASSLRVLDLGWNCIHDSGAVRLAAMLEANDSLEVLNLASNGIDNAGAEALASCLLPNNRLKELNLAVNQIRDGGAIKLAEAICHVECTLITLKWEDNRRISNLGRGRLEGAFRFREARSCWLGKTLRDIETRRNMPSLKLKLGDDELICICHHLGIHRPKLPFFKLSESMPRTVTNRGIDVLAKTVISQNCIPLKRLYVYNTHIGDRGAAAISQALLHNQYLTTLSLVSCDISDEGASFLANLLLRKTKLQRIDLKKNQIGHVGAQKLFHAICDDPVHPTVTTLNLSQNLLTDMAVCTLGSFEPLTEVFLGENMLTDRGALDLAKACMLSPKLARLHVPGNQMTKRGIQALNLFLPRDILFFESGNQKPPAEPTR
mmetsp:Transcript_16009/g.44064  ORF Transcript_16009/g.44064 Transcript_16009/m.44064 type:complete len:696 (+) Transcript_16009:267-2354(+)